MYDMGEACSKFERFSRTKSQGKVSFGDLPLNERIIL